MHSNDATTSSFCGVRKGSWTGEEDDLLRQCIEKYGEGNWHRVPQRSGLNRCRKSCRLRWMNYLKPNIKRGQFSQDEVDLIIRLHKLLGNRWSLIAGRLPGRTANDVKNYWNTHLLKKNSSSCRPPRHPNRLHNISSDSCQDANENPPKPRCAKTITNPMTKIIRPQPWTFAKTSSWLRRQEHVTNDGPSGPINGLDVNSFQVEEEELEEERNDDDNGDISGDIKWWESLLLEAQVKEIEELGIFQHYDEPGSSIGPCLGIGEPNNQESLDMWHSSLNEGPCLPFIEEHNSLKNDLVWDFDVNLWE